MDSKQVQADGDGKRLSEDSWQDVERPATGSEDDAEPTGQENLGDSLSKPQAVPTAMASANAPPAAASGRQEPPHSTSAPQQAPAPPPYFTSSAAPASGPASANVGASAQAAAVADTAEQAMQLDTGNQPGTGDKQQRQQQQPQQPPARSGFRLRHKARSRQPSGTHDFKGSKIAAYAKHLDLQDSSMSFYCSISAMPNFQTKSVEELRTEDYTLQRRMQYTPASSQIAFSTACGSVPAPCTPFGASGSQAAFSSSAAGSSGLLGAAAPASTTAFGFHSFAQGFTVTGLSCSSAGFTAGKASNTSVCMNPFAQSGGGTAAGQLCGRASSGPPTFGVASTGGAQSMLGNGAYGAAAPAASSGFYHGQPGFRFKSAPIQPMGCMTASASAAAITGSLCGLMAPALSSPGFGGAFAFGTSPLGNLSNMGISTTTAAATGGSAPTAHTAFLPPVTSTIPFGGSAATSRATQGFTVPFNPTAAVHAGPSGPFDSTTSTDTQPYVTWPAATAAAPPASHVSVGNTAAPAAGASGRAPTAVTSEPLFSSGIPSHGSIDSANTGMPGVQMPWTPPSSAAGTPPASGSPGAASPPPSPIPVVLDEETGMYRQAVTLVQLPNGFYGTPAQAAAFAIGGQPHKQRRCVLQ